MRHLTTAVHAVLSGAVVLGALLHVGWAEHVDPVGQTLSEHTLREATADLFKASVAAAATGSLAGLLRIRRSAAGAAAPAASSVGYAGLVLSRDLLANPTLSSDPDTAERIFGLMRTRPEIK
ncbi:hypothetical protein [Streptomyces europaeiscabiei]|uniref:hypothetical protein n=1 Tax=Streptomyces europaeiscabiei TaxID=146819 RepID=UPI0029AF2044|nr:hypothetical protein [Streptomyces europaeiscabiei]MDX2529813.1 hypothetical protein [Streptomyces europaeiscabiei]